MREDVLFLLLAAMSRGQDRLYFALRLASLLLLLYPAGVVGDGGD